MRIEDERRVVQASTGPLDDRPGRDPALHARGDSPDAIGERSRDLLGDLARVAVASTVREGVLRGQVRLGKEQEVGAGNGGAVPADLGLELVQRGRRVERDGPHLRAEDGEGSRH